LMSRQSSRQNWTHLRGLLEVTHESAKKCTTFDTQFWLIVY